MRQGLLLSTLLISTQIQALPTGLTAAESILKREILGETKFEVHCDDGSVEIARVQHLLANAVCGGVPVFVDEQMNTTFRLLSGDFSVYSVWTSDYCEKGFRVASPLEVREAIKAGIADPKINKVFGHYLSKLTRVWTSNISSKSGTQGEYLVAVTFNMTTGGTEKTETLSKYKNDPGGVLCVR